MSISVNGNTYSDAQFLDRAQSQLANSIDRLSSGLKTTSPGDDPGAISVSAKLDAQNSRLQAASTNVQNATSYIQTADNFVGNMSDVLSRMSQLTVLAKDPTKSPSDLADYADEFTQLQTQVRDTIGGTTAEIGGNADIDSPMGTFNGTALFGSSSGGSVQIGDDANSKLTIPQTNLQNGALLPLIQQDSSGNFTLHMTDANAQSAVTAGATALSNVSGELGAAGARLSAQATNLSAQTTSLTGTLSSIQDVDVASESTRLAKFQVLTQASTAILAQQNQDPKAVLALLQTTSTSTG